MILNAPAAERNKDPIWNVLNEKVLHSLDPPLRVLEFAAGAGVHTEYFTRKMVESGLALEWFPTDPEDSSLCSIHERMQLRKLTAYCRDPLELTLLESGIVESNTNLKLKDNSMNVAICINMIHISPWEATVGLFKASCEKLKKGGVLLCYGPFKEGGTAVASNLNFDASLQRQNPLWGVRDLERVETVARKEGMELTEKVAMPANNLCLIFQKT